MAVYENGKGVNNQESGYCVFSSKLKGELTAKRANVAFIQAGDIVVAGTIPARAIVHRIRLRVNEPFPTDTTVTVGAYNREDGVLTPLATAVPIGTAVSGGGYMVNIPLPYTNLFDEAGLPVTTGGGFIDTRKAGYVIALEFGGTANGAGTVQVLADYGYIDHNQTGGYNS